MFSLKSALFIIAPLFFSLNSYAKDFLLFDDTGKPVSHYDQTLPKITSNDLIHFLDGKTFLIVSILGDGATSRVYEAITNQKEVVALRLPLRAEYTSVMTTMIDAYQKTFIKIKDFPIVPILSFVREQYIVHAVQKEIVSYDTFLKTFKKSGYAKDFPMWLDLKKFARHVAPFRLIGDLREDQIYYTKSGWMILDWLDQSSYANDVRDPHVFKIRQSDAIPIRDELVPSVYREASIPLQFPRAFRKEIISIIHEERKKMGLEMKPTFLEKCESALKKLF